MEFKDNFVPGEGASSTQLVLVGEAPGKDEELEKRPFVGRAGRLLDDILQKCEVSRDEVYITNVVKVRPPDNKIYRLKEIGYKIEDFIPFLWKEIEAISPNCIVALGGTALKALTGENGIHKWRGSILLTNRGLPKVVPTFHPASLFERGGSKNEGLGSSPWRNKVFIEFDIKRAVEQSRFKDIKLPQRTLHVCHNSLDLYRFIERHSSFNLLSVDIETFKAIPICVGLAFTPWEAISVPLFDIMSPEEPEGIPMHDMIEIWRILAEILANPKIGKVGQNFKFDQTVLERHGFKVNNVFSDTMLLFHTLYPELPKKLQVISSLFTSEPFYKDEGQEFNPKKDSYNRLYLYNAKDAAITIECYEEMEKELREVAGWEDTFGGSANA